MSIEQEKKIADLEKELDYKVETINRMRLDLDRAKYHNSVCVDHIEVRWRFDPITEVIKVLVRSGLYKGIILRVPLISLYERTSLDSQFPSYFVTGNIVNIVDENSKEEDGQENTE